MPVSPLFQDKNQKDGFMESMLRICIDVGFGTIDVIRIWMNYNIPVFCRHDVAEVAGVPAFSIGEEGADRHVMIFKRECTPSDDELAALRRGEEWDPEKAKLLAQKVYFFPSERLKLGIWAS